MKGLYKLQIDDEFKYLIRALSEKERLQLEDNLLSDGCLNPIIVWQGIIVDGHNRYEICCRHNIPFEILEMGFADRDEVISWICKNQLGRRNISEETRKYLIGRQYESEKVILAKRNASGKNQHSPIDKQVSELKNTYSHKTAKRIAEENNLNYGTVQRYGALAKSIEEIRGKCPDLASKILSGKYKICRNNILALANLPQDALDSLNTKIDRNNKPFVEYSKTRNLISPNQEYSTNGAQSIKDMPKFDPDAVISELFLTIPSWISSINRVKNQANFLVATENGRLKLINELEHLKDAISNLLSKATEIK